MTQNKKMSMCHLPRVVYHQVCTVYSDDHFDTCSSSCLGAAWTARGGCEPRASGATTRLLLPRVPQTPSLKHQTSNPHSKPHTPNPTLKPPHPKPHTPEPNPPISNLKPQIPNLITGAAPEGADGAWRVPVGRAGSPFLNSPFLIC